MIRGVTSEQPSQIRNRTTLPLRRPTFPAQERRRRRPPFPAQQRRRQSLRQNPIPCRQRSILRYSQYISSIIKRILHRNCETISPPRATASKLRTLIFQKSREIIAKKLGRS